MPRSPTLGKCDLSKPGPGDERNEDLLLGRHGPSYAPVPSAKHRQDGFVECFELWRWPTTSTHEDILGAFVANLERVPSPFDRSPRPVSNPIFPLVDVLGYLVLWTGGRRPVVQ